MDGWKIRKDNKMGLILLFWAFALGLGAFIGYAFGCVRDYCDHNDGIQASMKVCKKCNKVVSNIIGGNQ